MRRLLAAMLVGVGLGPILVPATPIGASIAFTAPGVFVSVQERFETRVRLEGGAGQAWTAALLEGTTLLSDGGTQAGRFSSGQSYPFAFRYDARTGLASLRFAGVAQDQPIPLAPETYFAGFRLRAQSPADGSATTLAGLAAAVDGGAPVPIPDLTTRGGGHGLAEGPVVSLDAPCTEFSLSGSVVFDWNQEAARPDLNPGFSVVLLAGAVSTGACCFLNATCQTITPERCLTLRGLYQGDQVPCEPATCRAVPERPISWGHIKDLYRQAG